MEAIMTGDHTHHAAHTSNPARGAHGRHGGHGATGTITSISGSTFVVATKQGDVTVATDAATNFHTPGVARAAKQAGYDGYHDLTFAALKVGQRVGVMGERLDDATLLAERVHLPTP